MSWNRVEEVVGWVWKTKDGFDVCQPRMKIRIFVYTKEIISIVMIHNNNLHLAYISWCICLSPQLGSGYTCHCFVSWSKENEVSLALLHINKIHTHSLSLYTHTYIYIYIYTHSTHIYNQIFY